MYFSLSCLAGLTYLDIINELVNYTAVKLVEMGIITTQTIYNANRI